MSFETDATAMVEGFPAGLLRRFAALVVAEVAAQEGAVLGMVLPSASAVDADLKLLAGLLPAEPSGTEQATLRAMMVGVPA